MSGDAQRGSWLRAAEARLTYDKDLCLVATSPTSGECLRLEGAAEAVWDQLEYATSIEGLTRRLACLFEAPEADIASDVGQLLDGLAARDLLQHGPPADNTLRDGHLRLLKRAISNLLYPELEMQLKQLQSGLPLSGLDLQRHLRDIAEKDSAAFDAFVAAKREGYGPIRYAHSMIGLFRLNNIERCAEHVFADGVEGDFLEAGVCQGGAAIFMRALQRAHGQGERRTWVVDSFEGVPPSVAEVDRPYDLHLEEARQPWLAISERRVRDNFARYDLLDDKVEFVPGWLQETLPRAEIDRLAILRVDVDLYSATYDCLDLLYDRVQPGGFVIVDDYGYLQCCRDAVDAFRERRAIAEPLKWIDRSGVFWRKG